MVSGAVEQKTVNIESDLNSKVQTDKVQCFEFKRDLDSMPEEADKLFLELLNNEHMRD